MRIGIGPAAMNLNNMTNPIATENPDAPARISPIIDVVFVAPVRGLSPVKSARRCAACSIVCLDLSLTALGIAIRGVPDV